MELANEHHACCTSWTTRSAKYILCHQKTIQCCTLHIKSRISPGILEFLKWITGKILTFLLLQMAHKCEVSLWSFMSPPARCLFATQLPICRSPRTPLIQPMGAWLSLTCHQIIHTKFTRIPRLSSCCRFVAKNKSWSSWLSRSAASLIRGNCKCVCGWWGGIGSVLLLGIYTWISISTENKLNGWRCSQ